MSQLLWSIVQFISTLHWRSTLIMHLMSTKHLKFNGVLTYCTYKCIYFSAVSLFQVVVLDKDCPFENDSYFFHNCMVK